MENLVERMVDQIYFRNNMDRMAEKNLSETTKAAMIAINKALEESRKLKGRQRYDAEIEITKMIDALYLDDDKEKLMKAYDLCDNCALVSPSISRYGADAEKKLEAIKERLMMEEDFCE